MIRLIGTFFMLMILICAIALIYYLATKKKCIKAECSYKTSVHMSSGQPGIGPINRNANNIRCECKAWEK
jgi:hypothetical protein